MKSQAVAEISWCTNPETELIRRNAQIRHDDSDNGPQMLEKKKGCIISARVCKKLKIGISYLDNTFTILLKFKSFIPYAVKYAMICFLLKFSGNKCISHCKKWTKLIYKMN